MASASVNNCGGNDSLVRHLAWVVLGSIELVMERVRYRSLFLCDLVFYLGPVVGSVDKVVLIRLVQLRAGAAMDSFTVVLSLVVTGVGLVKVSSNHNDGVVGIGTLEYY